MKDLRKVVPPSRVILDGIWLSFYYGAKIGVLGPNGSGKSSLLRVMAGEDQDFQGEAWVAQGMRVGHFAQEPRLDATKDVKGNVEEAVRHQRGLLDRFNEISMAFAEPMDDGQMQKLLEEPDLLLLDEPTNHLDAESVAWLEHHLAEYKGTVVAVTHDRYFLDNVAKWILELDRGRGIPYEGNYSSWLDQKRTRLQQEEKQASARQRTLERELEWGRMAPRARQAKGKARIQRFEELTKEQQGEKLLQHEIVIPPPPRLGNDVVTAKELRKAYGDTLLFDGLSFSLPRGGIVGVIGPNGAGKTTLFRLIVGGETPDEGTLKVGETVQLAYVDQSRTLDPNKTAWEE